MVLQPRIHIPKREDGPSGKGPEVEAVAGRVRVLQEGRSHHPVLFGLHPLRRTFHLLVAVPLQPTESTVLPR